jgi:hypothetical protein
MEPDAISGAPAQKFFGGLLPAYRNPRWLQE